MHSGWDKDSFKNWILVEEKSCPGRFCAKKGRLEFSCRLTFRDLRFNQVGGTIVDRLTRPKDWISRQELHISRRALRSLLQQTLLSFNMENVIQLLSCNQKAWFPGHAPNVVHQFLYEDFSWFSAYQLDNRQVKKLTSTVRTFNNYLLRHCISYFEPDFAAEILSQCEGLKRIGKFWNLMQNIEWLKVLLH